MESVKRFLKDSKLEKVLDLVAGMQSGDKTMKDLGLLEAKLQREQSILKSLSFDSRPFRHGNITEAHTKTFRWALNGTTNEVDGVDPTQFLRWLRGGTGHFWISGKPGSGKSTFMKYVSDHQDTIAGLSRWASPKNVIIVSHFFWGAGTEMQRSQQGLLRTLLYEIFRQYPESIMHACSQERLLPPKPLDLDLHLPWTLSELHTTFQAAIQEVETPYKFCFFIDGLDEYDGDHFDICTELAKFSKAPNSKFCIASRAWNVFEDSFGGEESNKFYMQDLTKNDIQKYVESRLTEHPRWSSLSVNQTKAEWLLKEVTERASGVFLWVFLVTKLLREGLTEYDSFSDLCRRLESFPTDLEVFFKHILETVDPFYHAKMSTALQLAVVAYGPLPTVVYHFHDLEYEEEDYALNMSTETFDAETMACLEVQTSRRLNARCRGLLEVSPDGTTVDFLHRTVRDFLRTREMADFIASKAPLGHIPSLSLFRGYSAFLKCIDLKANKSALMGLMPSVEDPLLRLLALASELDDEKPAIRKPINMLLDNLEEYVDLSFGSQPHIGSSSVPTQCAFRHLVLRNYCANYVSTAISLRPTYFSSLGGASLSILLNEYLRAPTQLRDCWTDKCATLIHLLLDNGEDCNKSYSSTRTHGNMTPWEFLMTQILRGDMGSQMAAPDGLFIWAIDQGLLSHFLKRGANSNQLISTLYSGVSTIVSAWSAYLMTAFTFGRNADPDKQAKYLNTLDDFLQGAADLDGASRDKKQSHSQSRRSRESAVLEFCDRLQRQQGTSLNDPSYNRFLASVTQRLLLGARYNSWRMDPVWEAAKVVFDSEVVEALKKGCLSPRSRNTKRNSGADAERGGVKGQLRRPMSRRSSALVHRTRTSGDVTEYEADSELG